MIKGAQRLDSLGYGVRERALGLGFCLRAQAAGADVELDRLAAEVDGLLVDVRAEHATGNGRFALPPAGVPVADVTPEHRRLAADIALASHGESFTG